MQTSVAHSLSLLEGCMNCCWHYGPKSVIKLSTVAVLSVELLVNCSAESLFLKSLSTHQIAALILQKESFCSHTSYSHTSYSGYFSTMEEKKSLLSLLWCEMGIHFAKKYQRQPSKPELKSCLQGFWNEPEPSARWIQTEAEREKSGLIVQLIRQVEKGAFFCQKVDAVKRKWLHLRTECAALIL